MIFEIQKDLFLNVIQKSQSIVEKKTTYPVLQNVKLDASDGQIRVKATDMEIGLRDSAEAVIEQPGTITVSARKLYEVLKELGQGIVRFEVQENNWIRITCGSSEFKLVGMPDDDFPRLLEVNEDGLIEVSAEVLDTLASKSVYAASTDLNKHIYRGILMKVNGDTITMVSTDGHRLAQISTSNTQEIPDMEILIPRKGIQELQKMVSSGKETVNFGVEQNHIVFQLDTQTTTARLIDAQFPDFEKVIPRENTCNIRIDRMQFLDVCRRVSLFSDLKTHTITLELRDNLLKVEGSTPEYGEAHDELVVQFEDDPVKLNFNVTYLLEMLRVFDCEEVFMRFSPGGPVVFEPVEQEDYDYLSLIMPMIM